VSEVRAHLPIAISQPKEYGEEKWWYAGGAERPDYVDGKEWAPASNKSSDNDS